MLTSRIYTILHDAERLLNNVEVETAIITVDYGDAYGNVGVNGRLNQPLKILRKSPKLLFRVLAEILLIILWRMVG